MKKSYEAPSAEIIKFNYRDQVVAASGLLSNSSCVYTPHGNSEGKGNGHKYGHWYGNQG